MVSMLETAVEFITRWEGFRENAYLCPANVWTVGHGFTFVNGRRVRKGDTMTKEQSLELLRAKITTTAQQIDALVKVPLTDNQMAALVSFVFNLGLGAFQGSTLRRILNTGDYQGAAAQFDRWVFAGGRRLLGLVNRRRAERELFLK
jgi:lysozyme